MLSTSKRVTPSALTSPKRRHVLAALVTRNVAITPGPGRSPELHVGTFLGVDFCTDVVQVSSHLSRQHCYDSIATLVHQRLLWGTNPWKHPPQPLQICLEFLVPTGDCLMAVFFFVYPKVCLFPTKPVKSCFLFQAEPGCKPGRISALRCPDHLAL